VVGGGVIGVEYTCMFATLGVRVTLIEKRPRLLEFADAEMVEALCYHLRDRRVTRDPRLGPARTVIAGPSTAQHRPHASGSDHPTAGSQTVMRPAPLCATRSGRRASPPRSLVSGPSEAGRPVRVRVDLRHVERVGH